MYSSLSTLAVIMAVYMPSTSAQVLCDTVGCTNGVCVLPPVTIFPTCNCTAGFRLSVTNPTLCANVDECSEINYLCGVSYEPYLRTYVDSGRCVDNAGSYSCQCNPNLSLPSFDNKTCFPLPVPQQQPQQQQQQQLLQRLLNQLLLSELL
ncbi:latent-transforming growth factor beta-binding protein 1-like [Haliotis asinina]|uniref:latent-transforming growth factor beta-binding protein 1-like n=1 Tax=Haliotis asinina TaxID=109174 RepID=UPI0035325BCD